MAESENKVEAEDIGSVLKAAREAAGVSLDDVSALLKIRAVHLQALEEDDFDNVPGSVYAIGFIRTYANHLGLNAAELIERYKTATMPPHQEEAGYNPQTESEPISGALKIAIGVIGVFVFYILWLIAGGAGGDEKRIVEAAPAVEQTAPAAAVEKPAAKPIAKPVEKTAVPTQLPANSANDTKAVLPEADPIDGQPLVEVQPIGSLGEDIEQASAPSIIEIRATRRTWMRIEDQQGKVLFSSIIREGEGFTFGQDENYTLATRDAGALEFYVNEQRVDAVGRRGQILTARKIERAAVLSSASQ